MTRYEDDSQQIRDRLVLGLEQIMDRYWPGWMKVGSKILATPQKGAGGKFTSSFQVDAAGTNRGRWYRHSQQVGGGPLELLFYGHTGRGIVSKEDKHEAFGIAREFLGLERGRQESDADRRAREERQAQDRAIRERRRAAEEAREAAKKAHRAATAVDLWSEALPLAGSQGEAYLISRSIPPVSAWPWDPKDTIRFHPALDYELDKDAGRFPAVLAAVLDAFGQQKAIWQIYLAHGRPAKADLPNAKVGRGKATGCAIRIGGEGSRIGLAEGLESALSAWVLHGYSFPVWSGMSTAYSNFDPPIFVERVSAFPDGDLATTRPDGGIDKPPGIAAAERLAARLRPTGIRVDVNEPALYGDCNDFLKDWGQDL